MVHTYKYTSLTCVHYVSGDVVGKVLAYASLLPVMIFAYQSSKVYCRREVHQAVLLVGMAASEIINRVLKNAIQQPRPIDTCAALNVCRSHGMPSSHTQFMFFASTALCFASIWRTPARNTLALLLRATETMALLFMSVIVAVSRVYLGYHTVHQVLAGAVLGVTLGGAWASIMHCMSSLYACVAGLEVCRMTDVQDTWDLMRAKQA